jgi:hypothetical protein
MKLKLLTLLIVVFAGVNNIYSNDSFNVKNEDGYWLGYYILSNTDMTVRVSPTIEVSQQITSIKIPSSVINPQNGLNYTVIEITENAFTSYGKLKSITLPSTIKTIGTRAFIDCISLDSIFLPEKLEEIGESAFWGCTSLSSIIIPEKVTIIESATFRGCSSLNSVFLSDSVKHIGDAAFANCLKLSSITIPFKVTGIGNSSFKNCKSLISVTIPASVKEIGDYAFEYCDEIKTLTIGSGVESIGTRAFAYCKNLTSIKSRAVVPPTLGTDVFWGAGTVQHPTPISIMVPCGSLTAYNSSSWWNSFKNMQERCSEAIPTNNSVQIKWIAQASASFYELVLMNENFEEIYIQWYDNNGNPIEHIQNNDIPASVRKAKYDEQEFSAIINGLAPNANYYYGLTSYDDSDTYLKYIWGSFITLTGTTTDIIKTGNEVLSVYPNPAIDYLFIRSDINNFSDFKAVIVDIFGKKVYESYISSNSINIQNLNTGIYFFQLEIEGKPYSTKFIKH